jgi:hypothetical protein
VEVAKSTGIIFWKSFLENGIGNRFTNSIDCIRIFVKKILDKYEMNIKCDLRGEKPHLEPEIKKKLFPKLSGTTICRQDDVFP